MSGQHLQVGEEAILNLKIDVEVYPGEVELLLSEVELLQVMVV